MALTDIDEKKLSVIRRFPLETLIAAMAIAITYCIGVGYHNSEKIESLNTQMKTYLIEDRKILIQTLDNNTKALEDNSVLINKMSK
jgi:hypothetical protein